MYFSMLKLIDRSNCSFAVPEFQTPTEEQAWVRRLTPSQRLELLALMNEVRYGKIARSRMIDRRRVEVLSMEEFNAVKDVQYREDQACLAEAERKFWSSNADDAASPTD